MFERGGSMLGMPVWAVREVLSGEPATPVPQAPAHIAGVISVRGECLPLVLLDRWINLRRRSYRETNQILVVESDDVQMGVVVDRVFDVCSFETDDGRLVRQHDTGGGIVRCYVPRSGGRVTILDPQEVIEVAISAAAASFHEKRYSRLSADAGKP